MSMGREAGHLAYEIGKSIQAATIIIPEMFAHTEITMDKIVRLIISAMLKRRVCGVNSGVVVVSEGIFHFLKDEDIAASGIVFDYDAHGHPELSDVGKAQALNKIVRRRLQAIGLNIVSRPVEVGYSLRCTDPCAYDLSYCTTLGIGVKKLYEAGCSGCMVAVDINQQVIPVYLQDVEDENGKIRPRLVNMEREEVKFTFSEMMYYLTDADREAARQFVDNPEEFERTGILGY